MILVYRAGGQLIKVRALMLLSLIGLPLSLWWGFDLARTHGLREADGGILAPWPERLALGGLVAALGVGFAAAMGVYGRHYAARIEFDADSKQVHVETVAFLSNIRHIIKVAELDNVRPHRDDNWGVATAALVVGHPTLPVDAPWMSVRITGWRWPLIIDQQGVVVHPRLMQVVFRRRASAAVRDRS